MILFSTNIKLNFNLTFQLIFINRKDNKKYKYFNNSYTNIKILKIYWLQVEYNFIVNLNQNLSEVSFQPYFSMISEKSISLQDG